MLRAKVTVFLDLHRKNLQLERLLAQEQADTRADYGEVGGRLADLEADLDGEDPLDRDALRARIQEIRQLVSRGRPG